jgi:hypothetical protein
MSDPPACRLRPGERAELAPFVRAEDAAPARWATRAALTRLEDALRVDWRCVDPDPWATLEQRDAPLWTEEVVEIFLAPGAETPRRYFEIEISPRGTVFDAEIDSPHGDRRGMTVRAEWDAVGLERSVSRCASGWLAELRLPWSAICGAAPPPPVWRLNLFRIERPAGAPAEFTAWCPTLVAPADFHRPERFGRLELVS